MRGARLLLTLTLGALAVFAATAHGQTMRHGQKTTGEMVQAPGSFYGPDGLTVTKMRGDDAGVSFVTEMYPDAFQTSFLTLASGSTLAAGGTSPAFVYNGAVVYDASSIYLAKVLRVQAVFTSGAAGDSSTRAIFRIEGSQDGSNYYPFVYERAGTSVSRVPDTLQVVVNGGAGTFVGWYPLSYPNGWPLPTKFLRVGVMNTTARVLTYTLEVAGRQQ
jgi:hypothetical protein